MRSVVVLVAVVVSLLVGCLDSDSVELDYRHYEVQLVTEAECEQTSPIFNCTAELSLCADGSMSIIVTDIVNGGRYFRIGDQFVVSIEVGDVPNDMVFTLNDDGMLTDDFSSWTWTPSSLGSCPDDELSL